MPHAGAVQAADVVKFKLSIKFLKPIKFIASMSFCVVVLPTMNTFKPWLKYPSLTADRLSVIANIIRSVRGQAVKLYEPTSGDQPWDLGCRVYSRTCFALRRATESYNWLTVLEERESLSFTFAVGRVPVRFFRGDAEDAPKHYLITTPAEAKQQALALEFEGITFHDEKIRIAVETGLDHLASAVTLVTMDNDGVAMEGYSIPDDIQSAVDTTAQSAPIDLPPPVIVALEKTSLPPSHSAQGLVAESQSGGTAGRTPTGLAPSLFPLEEGDKDADAGAK
jgi:hypothetical protein